MTPVDVLDDDALLAVFDFCVADDGNQGTKRAVGARQSWQSLVHVCERWRCVVFGSPRRLNLRLVCTLDTPVRKRLDIWPDFPLIVQGTISFTSVDNIIAALEHRDRVCQIDLRIIGDAQWEKVLEAMRVPFPALTDLHLRNEKYFSPLVIPDSFLGGSAPNLRSLKTACIPFPGIPNLALFATHLVRLDFSDGPFSNYIQFEAMATCLSAMTNLNTLSFSFEYSRSLRRPPPITQSRSILPSLTTFRLKGVSECLDALVAQIDAPRLDHLFITFLDQMNFDTPHLVQFISRTPKFQDPDQAHVTLDLDADVQLQWTSDDSRELRVKISYEGLATDPQPFSMGQVCTVCFPPLHTVENLRIKFVENISEFDWSAPIENDQWLELLRPFSVVKNIHLSEESAPRIADALQELIGSRITEVLPGLQNIFVEGSEPWGTLLENIGQFVTARHLSGHPIAISACHNRTSN